MPVVWSFVFATLFAKIVASELTDSEFFRKEHQSVLDLCRKAPECSEKLGALDQSNQADLLDKYRLLEPYYEQQWRQASCLGENLPCGQDWGQCCSDLECQYILADNDDPDEPLIGLCSLGNVTYSMP